VDEEVSGSKVSGKNLKRFIRRKQRQYIGATLLFEEENMSFLWTNEQNLRSRAWHPYHVQISIEPMVRCWYQSLRLFVIFSTLDSRIKKQERIIPIDLYSPHKTMLEVTFKIFHMLSWF
jgi:hypothetical protein